MSLAAKLRGIPAYIVIPKNAPKCKVENVKRYGGQVTWSEITMQSREAVARKVQEDTGAVLIHPFNDGRIIRFFTYVLAPKVQKSRSLVSRRFIFVILIFFLSSCCTGIECFSFILFQWSGYNITGAVGASSRN